MKIQTLKMGMYKSIRYIRGFIFIVDYDFVVLAQNIIVHQTETIQHYQSPLSHALCSSKENTKMTALQTITSFQKTDFYD